MHVGIGTGFAHQRGASYDGAQLVREEVDQLVLAEELGFDSVWITEHHFSDYSVSNDPLQLLTYLAGRTKRVKLGTQCIIVLFLLSIWFLVSPTLTSPSLASRNVM